MDTSESGAELEAVAALLALTACQWQGPPEPDYPTLSSDIWEYTDGTTVFYTIYVAPKSSWGSTGQLVFFAQHEADEQYEGYDTFAEAKAACEHHGRKGWFPGPYA